MKKMIHTPTLLLHSVLLLDAACAINYYSDFFLTSALVLLIIYFIYCAKTVRKGTSPLAVCCSYGLGILVQILMFHSGLIDVNSGAFGLGGGEFALLFYAIGMIVSCVIVLLIALVCSPKKTA